LLTLDPKIVTAVMAFLKPIPLSKKPLKSKFFRQTNKTFPHCGNIKSGGYVKEKSWKVKTPPRVHN
jgi:hypothetical protein